MRPRRNVPCGEWWGCGGSPVGARRMRGWYLAPFGSPAEAGARRERRRPLSQPLAQLGPGLRRGTAGDVRRPIRASWHASRACIDRRCRGSPVGARRIGARYLTPFGSPAEAGAQWGRPSYGLATVRPTGPRPSPGNRGGCSPSCSCMLASVPCVSWEAVQRLARRRSAHRRAVPRTLRLPGGGRGPVGKAVIRYRDRSPNWAPAFAGEPFGMFAVLFAQAGIRPARVLGGGADACPLAVGP